MSHSADIKALKALGVDQRLLNLNGHLSSLGLVRALGVERDEVAHSRLLRVLLDPHHHRGATAMLGTILWEIADNVLLKTPQAERLRAVLGAPWERVSVRRELFLIDIVIEIASTRDAAVIGIENKIDAGEQSQQIARYQDALHRAYPDRAAVLVFLSYRSQAGHGSA